MVVFKGWRVLMFWDCVNGGRYSVGCARTVHARSEVDMTEFFIGKCMVART